MNFRKERDTTHRLTGLRERLIIATPPAGRYISRANVRQLLRKWGTEINAAQHVLINGLTIRGWRTLYSKQGGLTNMDDGYEGDFASALAADEYWRFEELSVVLIT